MTRAYGPDEWHEDLKNILSKTASTEVHGVFLFTDTQVTETFQLCGCLVFLNILVLIP